MSTEVVDLPCKIRWISVSIMWREVTQQEREARERELMP